MMASRMSGRRRLLASTTLAGLVAFGGGGAALAQDAPENAARVQEVIVTAQRRAQRLQDVPMSVTALSAETLTRAGVTNTADLQKVTPGLNTSFFGTNLQPTVRGVSGLGGNLGDTGAVALYVDGAYQPHQIAALIDLPDVQQIEVLKGPQGTLWGQNATGGAITVTTVSPTFTPSGRLSASYGNYNDFNVRGYVSGPISDQLAFSLSGGYQDHKGYRRHVTTGERDDGLTSKLIRGKLLYAPIDAAKFTLTAYHSDRDDTALYGSVAFSNNSKGYAIFPNAPRATSPKQFSAYPGVFARTYSDGFSAKGDFDVDVGTVTSILSWARTKTVYLADLDSSPVNLAEYQSRDQEGKYKQAEVNFASRKFGRFSFLAGASYLNMKDAFKPGAFILRSPNLVPAAPNPPIFQLVTRGLKKREILSGYAEASFDITDKFVVTAGGRYTHETQRAYSSLVNGVASPTLTMTPYANNPEKWSKFSPRLTARYTFSPNQNVYATYSQGFRGGQINTGDIGSPAVDPETITAYEIGYKGRIADIFQLNVAAFRYNYKDLQVPAYIAPLYVTQNAASARGKGVDVEASWYVTPELTLSAAAEYLDANYRHFTGAQAYIPTGRGNLVAPPQDLSGEPLLRSPKWSGSVSASYQTDIEAGRIGAYVSLYFTDNFVLESTNRIYVGAYQTLDAELSFAPNAIEGLRLVAWGKNLTDKAYLNQAVVSTFGDSVSYAAPRTYGVRVEYAF